MDPLKQTLAKSRSITVLHIAPTPFFSDRGCHMRIRGIIYAMNKRSVTSVLATYNLGRDIEGVETVRTPSIPGYTKLEAGPSAFKYLADILLFIKVIGLISSRKPDIIHTHLHEGALLGWTARLFFFWRKIPLVFDIQGSLVGELEAHGYFKKYGFLKKLFRFMEYQIVRMPDQIVCSSQNSIDVLRKDFNVKEENITLVNDGADEFDIRKDEALIKKLALPANKAIIIYSGALLEAKGLSYLCETILESSKRNMYCHFLIIGYPEKGLQDYCERKSLLDRCTIVGRVPYEKLGMYLALADLAVEPKLSDSGEASGKLLNYMGAGLPVVCFDTKSNRQILGALGYYSPQISTSLIDQIEMVLSDPTKAGETGAASRKRVHDEFSWGKAGEKIQDVYLSCLAQAR